MIRALEGLTPEWYEPAGQVGNDRTSFHIRPLDGAEFGEIADGVKFTDNGVAFIGHQARDRCLTLALLGWKGFTDSSGALPFTRANMRLIPHETRVSIVNRILAISTLDGEQEKN